MRPGPLRAGLVGLGAMGRHHARVLASLDGVDLVAIVEPGPTPLGVPHGVPVVPTVAEMIALGVDYAVVACPTALHEEIALMLAEAGVSALIEKPLAPTVESARRIAAAFEQRGLVGGVGHIERYNPALLNLRTRLEVGELGDVFQIVTRRQGPFPHRISDVGVVMDLATHDIDLTRWVAGSDYASVSARTVFRSGRPHEDMVVVIGELVGGTVVSHLVNWLSPLKERSTVITGERGCFVADTLHGDLTFFTNSAIDTEWEALRAFRGVAEGDMIRYAIPKREPLLVEHEAFRDAVEGKDDNIVTLAQGVRTVEVSAAVLRSAETGSTVDVASTAGAPVSLP